MLQGLHMALQECHVLHLHPQVARVAHQAATVIDMPSEGQVMYKLACR